MRWAITPGASSAPNQQKPAYAASVTFTLTAEYELICACQESQAHAVHKHYFQEGTRQTLPAPTRLIFSPNMVKTKPELCPSSSGRCEHLIQRAGTCQPSRVGMVRRACRRPW